MSVTFIVDRELRLEGECVYIKTPRHTSIRMHKPSAREPSYRGKIENFAKIINDFYGLGYTWGQAKLTPTTSP